ncbi:phage integrase central domain-containing protein, partial [Salmonella enterica subsp. enterica serovar Agbeni]
EPPGARGSTRAKRENARRLLAKFIDSLEEQRASQEKVRRVRVNTFKNVAANWYELKKAAGLKPHTLQDIWNSLNRYVFPHIGEINIDELTAQQVIAALEPCRADGKLETVKRMTQRSEPASLCASGASKVTPRPDTLAFVGRIPAFWAQVKQINCCWHLSPF